MPAEGRPQPGRPLPLGAAWDGAGVNFALWSEHALRVDLCLFDAADPGREIRRIAVTERTDHIWHVYLADARPGMLYGYRVDGPWAPGSGHRFNAAKVLLDPYARAIAGTVDWTDAIFDHRGGELHADSARDERDDAAGVPKSVVIDSAFAWGDDRPPRTPWHRTVIYEAHVKGFTYRHPDVPREARGTYAGLASPAAVAHLERLGVTAVELLPVHHSVTERAVHDRGLVNYWGYSSIGFFAPDARYAADDRGAQVAEFQTMVKALHRAGIEVILDVVYNHTAEGDHRGPTLCFRGIDNAAYYRLDRHDPRRYVDDTGCGNTFNTAHPRVLQLVMDSLRFWVDEMHVDGFRFDLAPALTRGKDGVVGLGSFLDVVGQDPVLSRVKLIAEPWDLGEGGYHAARFPVGWAEWNDRYRNSVRRYWRGDAGELAELGYRLTGSSDLYEASGRGPSASVNFVTAHDGFTLADLVSYNTKHNEGNGEDNRDGTDENFSWNGGVEGPTDDAKIRAFRERQMRNFLATLFLSQGVPMLSSGDEIARTQHGNNNAYCQDNDLSWLQWSEARAAGPLLDITARVIRLRLDHPVFRQRAFLHGRPVPGTAAKDLSWFRPDGKEMGAADWHDATARALGMQLSGDTIEEADGPAEPGRGDTLLVLLNANPHGVPFILPGSEGAARWTLMLDTRAWQSDAVGAACRAGQVYDLEEHSLAVLRLIAKPRG